MKMPVNLDMVSRVEGHGSLELIRDGGSIVDARFKPFESPRLFEALLRGRRFDEVADIVCRICSICSTVHKVAALQAVEQAMGVQVLPQTRMLRELAVLGGQIESHALHIFCLAMPDYLGVSGFPALDAAAPEQLQVGLRLKKIGNTIQETVGGRAIHPPNLQLGGMGRIPDHQVLRTLQQMVADMQRVFAEQRDYLFALGECFPSLTLPGLCAVKGGRSLFGDSLETSDGAVIKADNASSWCNECVTAVSTAKVSDFRDGRLYQVGPLARVMLSMPDKYASAFSDASIWWSTKARAVELEQGLEQASRIIQLLVDQQAVENAVHPIKVRSGNGVAVIEAPRGTLIHCYEFDEAGCCTHANVITPTAINQKSINAALHELIGKLSGEPVEQIQRTAEMVVRCYDPCISCAVH